MKNTNLILGKISSGKTTGYMFNEMDAMINNGENLLIVDNKEEYYKTYKNELESKGYDVKIINFNNPKNSNGFNPFLMPYKYYNSDNKGVAVKLLENIFFNIMANDAMGDPFWTNSSATYLTGIMLMILKGAAEEETNICSVQIATTKIEENIDKMQKYVSSFDLVSPEYMNLSTTLYAPSDTRLSIVSTIKAELAKYLNDEGLIKLLCSNEIDLTNLKEKTAIFVVGNNDYKKLTNLVINEVMNSNIKFNYILDNFDSLSRFEMFDDLLDRAVIDRYKVYVISRNIENLLSRYGKLITDKFEVNETIENKSKIKDIPSTVEYPDIKVDKVKYYDITKTI